MVTAIYPGSFDPAHLGHLDVARRGAQIFDRLIFAVNAGQSAKTRLFTVEERVELARVALADVPNVIVDSFQGLLVDYARQVGARVIVKGLRTVADFGDEFQQAHMNGALMPGIESVFLMTRPEYAFMSSTLLKEVARLGGRIGGMVPPGVEQALRQRFGTLEPV